MSNKLPQIPALTGLRFYAAWLVLYDHSVAFFFQPLNPHALAATLLVTRLGMTLFFVLSGFVIHYNYAAVLDHFSVSSVRSFAVARFARLYPLYLLAFVAGIAAMAPPIGDRLSAVPVLTYLTMTQDWWPVLFRGQPIYPEFSGVAWSISVEAALYLLYVPLAPWLGRLTWHRALMVLIAILVVGGVVDVAQARGIIVAPTVTQYNFFYHSPLARAPEFMLGAVAAQLVMLRNGKRAAAFERWPILVAGLITLVVVYGGAINGNRYSFVFDAMQYSFGFAPGCAAVMYYCARNPGRHLMAVEAKPIVALGDASYSIYLLSWSGLVLFASMGLPANYLHATFRMLCAWGFIVLLALGSYHYFEAPARRFLRRALAGSAHNV